MMETQNRGIETFIETLGRGLRGTQKHREVVLMEVRDHLNQEVDSLKQKGFSEENAIRSAIQNFGDVKVFTESHNREAWKKFFEIFVKLSLFFSVGVALGAYIGRHYLNGYVAVFLVVESLILSFCIAYATAFTRFYRSDATYAPSDFCVHSRNGIKVFVGVILLFAVREAYNLLNYLFRAENLEWREIGFGLFGVAIWSCILYTERHAFYSYRVNKEGFQVRFIRRFFVRWEDVVSVDSLSSNNVLGPIASHSETAVIRYRRKNGNLGKVVIGPRFYFREQFVAIIKEHLESRPSIAQKG